MRSQFLVLFAVTSFVFVIVPTASCRRPPPPATRAELTLYVTGGMPRKAVVDDPKAASALAALFSQLGQGRSSGIAASSKADAEIRFLSEDGKVIHHVTIAYDFQTWSEGHGDWDLDSAAKDRLLRLIKDHFPEERKR